MPHVSSAPIDMPRQLLHGGEIRWKVLRLPRGRRMPAGRRDRSGIGGVIQARDIFEQRRERQPPDGPAGRRCAPWSR